MFCNECGQYILQDANGKLYHVATGGPPIDDHEPVMCESDRKKHEQ